MQNRKKIVLFTGMVALFAMFLTSCGSQPAPEPIIETVVVTKEVEGQTIVEVQEVVVTATPAPTPVPVEEDRELVICLGQEPDTLYPYGSTMSAMQSVLQAIYDGPFDTRSFDNQAVILQKMPSLADGDALIQTIDVSEGDVIVDINGDPVALANGMLIREAGCSSNDCATEYQGGTVTMDQMVVTFQLLPGLTWSDGIPLTANDSVYSYELNSSPDTSGDKSKLQRTAAYEALDDITLQWIGLPGYKDSTYYLNMWTPYPRHLWGQFTPLQLLDEEISSRMPIGWGPYIIEEWNENNYIRMRKNPSYFRADEGLPKFESLVYRFVGENSNKNIAKILNNECDIVDQTANLADQSELLLELQSVGKINATFVTGTVFEHVDFGIVPVSYDDGWQAGERPDFFGDVTVRRAIAHCMDRQGVIDNALFGQSIVLDTYLPPEHPLYNPEVPSYAYDIETGSALLEEAGWTLNGSEDGIRLYVGDNPNIPQGTRLSFTLSSTSATLRQDTTEILSQSMRECGIETELEYWSPREYFADGPDGPLLGRKFDLTQLAWQTGDAPPCQLWISEAIPGEDVDVFPYGWGGWNITGYSNPEFDATCKAAIQSLPGQPSYTENHLKAQEIFATDLPVVPLYLRLKLAVTRPDMCNFEMDPTANSEMWNIEEFDYGDCSETE